MGEKLHDSYIVSNTLLGKDIQSPRYSPQIQFVSVELKPNGGEDWRLCYGRSMDQFHYIMMDRSKGLWDPHPSSRMKRYSEASDRAYGKGGFAMLDPPS